MPNSPDLITQIWKIQIVLGIFWSTNTRRWNSLTVLVHISATHPDSGRAECEGEPRVGWRQRGQSRVCPPLGLRQQVVAADERPAADIEAVLAHKYRVNNGFYYNRAQI